jgi:hypothetical protein
MGDIHSKKDLYRKLCDERQDIPLFMQAWWMDAACDTNRWDVLFFEKGGKIIATWVYHFVKKLGFKIVIQPQLTQTNGIWINRPSNISKNEMISFENEVLTNLIQQFQKIKFCYFDQNFHLSFTNWLPFYWNGYEQTTRYTYQIKDISDPQKCFLEFRPSKKSHINKANKSIRIDFELPGEEFYKNLQQNLKAYGHKVYYSNDRFIKIFNACKSRNQGCTISAYDNQNRFHAALFIVWDVNSAYNLISTINPEFRSSGAASLLFFEAIKHMSSKTKTFDFEGSMSKNIERSFREFGAVQVPYFRIRKFNSYSFRILYLLKKWI